MSTDIIQILTGLATGGVLGWALQRGGFCMNTAFRSIAYKEDRSVLRAWVLVLMINMPIVAGLETLGWIYPLRAPFTPLSLVAGGLLFGSGMVLAGSCASGAYYRSAKGMLGSLFALLGFLIGVVAATHGILSPLRQTLNRVEWTIAGEIPSMGHVLPQDPWLGRWIAIGVVVILGLWFLIKSPKSHFNLGWKWPVTGTVIGILSIAAWIFSSWEARDYGISIIQPSAAWSRLILAGNPEGLNWTAWMLLALPPGAFFAAWKSKDLRFRLPAPKQAFTQFCGGAVMGLGAALAGGCNFGHGITGISALALSSLTAIFFTMLGNWGATRLVWSTARKAVQAKRF